ncbi:hypothetical protein GCM10010495_24040 [Kitasatospora herbaricolor]|uniref:Uncharacterized protein n=1 Tax=Kitasatospora herbaricolor TaxID=68217 RepID=A0ABZ1WC03_9ACTN|nr:hypothetical protein [Kitasatospora herbaricolor]MDQ0308813.1 hypothetical protein [Kitasatospora herbaricolor]GGV10078.1 hypothetical protein GCM10010495_24040 [Kitasatospora herbaricolor]
MRKHRLDLFSLIAGALFTVVATLYLVASLNDFSVNGRIVIPVTFIVLGTAGLAGAVLAMARRGRTEAPAAPRTAPGAPGTPEGDLDAHLRELGLLDGERPGADGR